MKKSVFVSFILLACSLHAQQILDLNTGIVSHNMSTVLPHDKIVEECAEGLKVTHNFNSANISIDTENSGTVIFTISGYVNETQPGKPAVPTGADIHFIPLQSHVDIEILSCKYKELDYKIAPARTPICMLPDSSISSAITPIAPYSGYWPNSFCTLSDVGRHRNQSVVNVGINPIQYNVSTGKVKILTELIYKVKYDTPQTCNTNFKDFIINPNFIDIKTQNENETYYREPGWNEDATAGLVIISVPEFESALEDFILWKKRLGYNVKAFYDNQWDSTKISSAIQNTYWKDKEREIIDTNFNLSYLLFIGNDSLVPSRRIKYSHIHIDDNFYLTDLPYAYMDDNDRNPDIYRGRWPVSFKSEVESIVKKLMKYERNPPINPNFYSKGAHFAFFEDGSDAGKNDGEEDGRFVKTSEDILNYLTDNYEYDIKRIYTIDSAKVDNSGIRHWPLKWTSRYSEGGFIAAELRHENGFNWLGDNLDLRKAINDGISYLFVSGHGWMNSWSWGTNRSFAYYDVMPLKNMEEMPVIFTISCLVGKFNDYRCLMRQFLSKPDGGAIGAFASSHVNWYNQVGTISQHFVNSVWPNPGISLNNGYRGIIESSIPTQKYAIKQMGVILDNITYNLRTNDYYENFIRNTLHCFGDPTMYFRTEMPTKIEEYTEINRTQSGINTYVHDNEAYISYYDPTTDKTTRCYGTEASYFPSNPDAVKYIDVTVYTPNSLPYVDYGEYYPGYVAPNSSSSRLLGFRSNYDNTTATVEYIISDESKNKRLEILIVDMSTGNIISSLPLRNVEPNIKNVVNIYCHSGLMTASLMIDGYPVSNIKTQIKF